MPGFNAGVLPSGIEEVTVHTLGRHGVAAPIFEPRGTCDTLNGGRDVAMDGESFRAEARAEAPTTAPRKDESEEGDEDDPVVLMGRSD